MPDQDADKTYHSFDREPSTGRDSAGTTEHADLRHRLESDNQLADAHEAQQTHQNPPINTAESTFVPAAVQPVEHRAQLPKAGPGLLVLQWMVYALWGWTILALSMLILIIVDQMINTVGGSYGRSYWFPGDQIAYPLAAAIVLFVIAMLCDIFYARADRRHSRSTGSNVIMIIHAVLFALLGIGALIIAVFGGVKLLIGDTMQGNGAEVNIVSGLIIFVLYAATLVRTLRPVGIKKVAGMYWVFMTIVLVVTVTLAIMGPAAFARLRAQDAVLEQGLPSLSDSINSFTTSNNRLPNSLNELTDLSEDVNDGAAKKLVEEKLVSYTPGEQLTSNVSARQLDLQRLGVDQLGGTIKPVFHYTLCVNYKTSDGYDGGAYDSKPSDQKYYVGVSTFGHKAGKVCYEAQTAYSNQ